LVLGFKRCEEKKFGGVIFNIANKKSYICKFGKNCKYDGGVRLNLRGKIEFS